MVPIRMRAPHQWNYGPCDLISRLPHFTVGQRDAAFAYIAVGLDRLEQTLSKPSDGIPACLEQTARDNGRHAPEQEDASVGQAITHELHFASPRFGSLRSLDIARTSDTG